MSSIQLYDFQQAARAELLSLIRAGRKRILLVMPTGAGKGTLASNIIQSASERGKRVGFLVNRRELVKDLSRRLDKLGLDHGVIMANHPRRKPWLNVHIASIDSLRKREHVPPVDLLFVDEAHFSVSPGWKEAIARFGDVPLIGMTATPCRQDGTGLGDIYEVLVMGPTVAELEERGFLVKTRVFAPTRPDLKGVSTQAGDYNQKQLAEAVDRPKLTGDIVEHWLKLSQWRPTVAFCVNVDHSQHICKAFNDAGVRAQHVDANTPDAERDKLWSDLANGVVKVCTSVGVISYGWDVPPVSCAILARPTQSLALYLQQIGRIKRIFSGKADAIILDHAGATLEHGFDNDEREWTLEGSKAKKKKKNEASLPIRVCKMCWTVMKSTVLKCPTCGYVYEPKRQEVKVGEGTLQEIDRKLKPAESYRRRSDEEKRKHYQELLAIAAARGYSPKWAPIKCRAIYGFFPPKEWRNAESETI